MRVGNWYIGRVAEPMGLPQSLSPNEPIGEDAPDWVKLRWLADVFDIYDRRKIAAELGVTEMEVPDYMIRQATVQADLRRIADQLESLAQEAI